MDDSGPTHPPTHGGSTSLHTDEVRTELGTTDEGNVAPKAERAALGPGAVVGRYVIVAELGAGAMGVVYAAYDPELDRKVALKVMAVDAGDAERRREAMVLAKVNHPNVVAVHDVGTGQGWTWIAMELVVGDTLRARLAAGPIPWATLVPLMIDAARGLAAAHTAGLVHRDVKPDNIMIGSDGRVRVMDFGLAREHSGTSSSRGARAGSPAYMAPEQHAGLASDPRTDVFGWSVTFFEALCGVRPFTADSPGALVGAIATGRRREIPPGIAAPSWLREAIVGGLQPDPVKRWQSLDDAIARLHRGMASGRRRKLLLLGAGLTGLLATPSLLDERNDRVHRRECEDKAAAIDAVWNDEARTSIRAALTTEATGDRPSAAEQTAGWFDGAAGDWKAVYLDACTAAIDSEREPAAIYACLDERRMSMATTIALLSQPEPGPFGFTPAFVVDALEVRGCAALTGIGATASPADTGVREGVSEVRLQMLRAAAWAELGDLERSLADAMAAHEHAVALGWAPLVAEAAARVGWVIDRGRDPTEAPQWIERAVVGALAEPDSELVIRLAVAMARVLAERRNDPEAAMLWLALADRRIERLGLRDTLHDAMYWTGDAAVARVARRFEDAIVSDRRALDLRTTWLGDHHPLVASSWNNLAGDHGGLYENEDGLAAATQAYTLRHDAFGPGHPEVLSSAINVAVMMSRLGDHDLAIEMLEEQIGDAPRVVGPDHPLVGAAWHNLATSIYRNEDYVGTFDPMKLAYELRAPTLDPSHPDIAAALNNLAAVSMRLDQCVDAMHYAEQGVKAREAERSPKPDELALSMTLQALIEWRCRRTPRALLLAERAATLVPSDKRDAVETVYARLGMLVAEVDPIRGLALVLWVAERAPAGEIQEMAREWQSPDFRR